jgi:carbonic anhydrase
MRHLTGLFANNRAWAARVTAADPEFFSRLASQQAPEYLWIGCSDSRVPANEIVDLLPGELFVHRNVANIVVHTDLNCLSVLQFAVDVLKVRHVIVCGHYGCGGVRAALTGARLGLIDNWLRHVQDVRERHEAMVAAVPEGDPQVDRLCELNVIEQVRHVCETTIVQDAWTREQELVVHGLVYRLGDGLLRDLQVSMASVGDVTAVYRSALAATAERAPGALGRRR